MQFQQIVNGLKQLGFNSGWAVSGEEIVLWENNVPQPSEAEILEASNLWDAKEAEREAEAAAAKAAAEAKLAALGLTSDDLKALGLA